MHGTCPVAPHTPDILADDAIVSQDLSRECFGRDLRKAGRADYGPTLLPNQAPAIWASADVVGGPASLTVQLAASGPDPERAPGDHTARVTVTGEGGHAASPGAIIRATVPGQAVPGRRSAAGGRRR